ncbi:MAG TPA: hypothetical protein VFV90_10865 [Usitatibacter sp.]|nr:hypothetical protein [Usitatibacter sp.]
MNIIDGLKKALPWIGAAATGGVPALVGLAANEVSKVLGVEVPADGESIAKAVQGATPEQRLALLTAEQGFKERMQAAGFKHEEELARIDLEAAKAQTDRIAALEGTASDLKVMPILGPVMLLARGAQRPVWGFFTIWLDYQVFSGAWKLADGPVTYAFYLVNLLVLAFLFGERAIKNVAPLITDLLAARARV